MVECIESCEEKYPYFLLNCCGRKKKNMSMDVKNLNVLLKTNVTVTEIVYL